MPKINVLNDAEFAAAAVEIIEEVREYWGRADGDQLLAGLAGRISGAVYNPLIPDALVIDAALELFKEEALVAA